MLSSGARWLFQHTAARRRLAIMNAAANAAILFQHTAARRRLGAALQFYTRNLDGFNTQPPEGGWF